MQNVSAIKIVSVVFLMAVCSCKNNPTFFTLLPSSKTNISFINTLPKKDSLNIMNYVYAYNGGGVGTGDLNNDGLPDIYFSSNTGNDKLYINKGNFQFEDITAKSGIKNDGSWNTGVTFADVNGDGWLDIYVCSVNGYLNLDGKNHLYINNHNFTFTESALEYGLQEPGFNTQAVFFDYDLDGDLDMFLVKHTGQSSAQILDTVNRHIPDMLSGDKLFRNELSNGKKYFSDVTKGAGIFSGSIGCGLNAIINDFNNDGWPDIYVSNDFYEEDYYYLNNKNGTFSEQNKQVFRHQSRFSMGSDAADINNDGWQDIITLDMLPEDEKVLKSSISDDPPEIYNYKLSFGYQQQFSKNCLQINNGEGKSFSDISLYAGVASTDWSWSPLLADFDNDGLCDLFVSNGIYRRPNNLDFIKYYANNAAAYDVKKQQLSDAAFAIMPEGKVANYFYRGSPSLKFINDTQLSGLNTPGFSTGAAYADFDNDGDLDLVVNNINEQACVYKNNEDKKNNYLVIHPEGEGFNKKGLGVKLIISAGGTKKYIYYSSSKGFQSCSAGDILIGLGKQTTIDSVQVIWPDSLHSAQTLVQLKPNQTITVAQNKAIATWQKVSNYQPLFSDVSNSYQIDFKHIENEFNDFEYQPLIPHAVSTQGPAIAIGDVNGDKLDDFFICGASGQPGCLFLQTAKGGFIKSPQSVFGEDKNCEDVNAVFFDADNDGDADLYVVSGGNQFTADDRRSYDRLYINNGKGIFSASKGLPAISGNKSVAVAADIDHDGDMDLFVGGRVVTGRYGEMPTSYLLLNDGKGNFTISTTTICPEIEKLGFVTDAAWEDINNDGWADLIVSGEWMPVSIFLNERGRLINATAKYGLANTSGLWNCLRIADINNDGVKDILVGNLGENSKLHASLQFPLKLYFGDFDGNGTAEQILCIEHNGSYYSFLGKEELEKIIPSVIKKKYLDYSSFAGQTAETIFNTSLQTQKLLTANTLSSMAFVNDKGRFKPYELPKEIQYAPVFSWLTGDFNKDGLTDIIAGGNFFAVLPYEGRYDASNGTLLLGQKNGSFINAAKGQSGFQINGEIRSIKQLKTFNSKSLILVGVNNNQLKIFQLN